MPQHERLIIVGSGPAGYTAALYAARANLARSCSRGCSPADSSRSRPTSRTIPASPRAILGPEMMELFRKQAERFGTRFIDGRRDAGRSLAAAVPARGEDDALYTADAVIVATGASAKWLGIPSEKQLQGQRRLRLRDLRRLLLQGQGGARRRRRRHRDGGGHLPHQVRDQGARAPPPRHAARVEDHAGPGAGEPEDRASSGTRRGRGDARATARGHRRAAEEPEDGRRHASCRAGASSSRSATSPTPRSSRASSRWTTSATSSVKARHDPHERAGRVRGRRRRRSRLPAGGHRRRLRLHGRDRRRAVARRARDGELGLSRAPSPRPAGRGGVRGGHTRSHLRRLSPHTRRITAGLSPAFSIRPAARGMASRSPAPSPAPEASASPSAPSARTMRTASSSEPTERSSAARWPQPRIVRTARRSAAPASTRSGGTPTRAPPRARGARCAPTARR